MSKQNKKIAKKLKAARLDAELMQKDLIQQASRLDKDFKIAKSTYSLKENGERSITINEAEIFSIVLSKKLNKTPWEIYRSIFLNCEFADSKHVN